MGDLSIPQRPFGIVLFLIRTLDAMAGYCKSAPVYLEAIDGSCLFNFLAYFSYAFPLLQH